MKTPGINPIYWRLDNLLTCETDTIHELACKAAGTLTSYRLVVGRCLLALQETGRYRDYGVSTAMHYATNVLGLAYGRRLDRAYDIEFAGWLNYWMGWKGGPWDSHLNRVMDGTWSPTALQKGLAGTR